MTETYSSNEGVFQFHSSTPHSALCFLFITLSIGSLITLGTNRIQLCVPYTVIVFIVGILIAFLLTSASTTVATTNNNSLAESISAWNNIDSHLILHVFLPALLFGEAMQLNPHQFRTALPSSLLLAFPGAVFSAVAIAAGAKYLLPYDWSWSLCLILGAILCTTDAVAIVALLKKAGASNRLGYVIVGESLFNDGTALILYNILFSWIQASNSSSGGSTSYDLLTLESVGLYMLRVTILSPILGVLFGLVAVFLLSLATHRMEEEDSTVQIAVTLSCAYLSFFVGEEVMQISGVISCVVAGIVLANYAPPLILHRHTMHSVWSTVEWVGNTLIFMLAGLMIGSRCLLYVEPRDVACILITYLVVSISRWLMMLLLYPMLSRIGNKCTAAEAVFISWGGLRGAVGMAIALSLTHSVEAGLTVVELHDAHRVFILVGGTAALTLVINAVLSDAVLRSLKLVTADTACDGDSSVGGGNTMVRYVKKQLLVRSVHALDTACNERARTCSKQLVTNYCSLLRCELSTATESSGGEANILPDNGSQQTHSSADDSCASTPPPPSLSMLSSPMELHMKQESVDSAESDLSPRAADSSEHFRRAYLQLVKVHYWRQIGSGTLPRQSSATRILLHSVDVALESAYTECLNDWEVLLKRSGLHSATTDSGTPMMETGLPSEASTPWHRAEKDGDALALELSTLNASDPAPYAPYYRVHHVSQNELLTPTPSVSGLATSHRFTQWMPHPFRGRRNSVTESRASPSSHLQYHSVASTQKQDAQCGGEQRAWLADYHTAKEVHILIAFIAAHEYAAHKMHTLLTTDRGAESVGVPSPGATLMAESQTAITHAKQKLAAIDPNTVTLHVSKQTARWILHSQEDWIAEFQKEGILSEKEAFRMLHTIHNDLKRLGATEWLSILIANVVYKMEHILCYACSSDVGDGASQSDGRPSRCGSANAVCSGGSRGNNAEGGDSSSEHGSDIGLELQLRVLRVRAYNDVHNV